MAAEAEAAREARAKVDTFVRMLMLTIMSMITRMSIITMMSMMTGRPEPRYVDELMMVTIMNMIIEQGPRWTLLSE